MMSSNFGSRRERCSAYVASKHAVIGLMRSPRSRVRRSDIRVNTVDPSPIEGRMMQSLEEGFAPGAGARGQAGDSRIIPAGRDGTPEEVADLVLFLASDESSYCSGGVYVIDGARTAR